MQTYSYGRGKYQYHLDKLLRLVPNTEDEMPPGSHWQLFRCACFAYNDFHENDGFNRRVMLAPLLDEIRLLDSMGLIPSGSKLLDFAETLAPFLVENRNGYLPDTLSIIYDAMMDDAILFMRERRKSKVVYLHPVAINNPAPN